MDDEVVYDYRIVDGSGEWVMIDDRLDICRRMVARSAEFGPHRIERSPRPVGRVWEVIE